MNELAKLWISRDTAGSGLYTLWAYHPPKLNEHGLFEANQAISERSALLMSIHPARWPWDEIKLERGEVIEVELGVLSVDGTDKVEIETL